MTCFKHIALAASLVLAGCSFKNNGGLSASGMSALPQVEWQGETFFQTDGSRGQFDGVISLDKKTSRTVVGFTAQVRLVDPAFPLSPLPPHPFEYAVSDTPQWPAGVAGRPAEYSAGEFRVQGEIEYLELARSPETYRRKYIVFRSTLPQYQGVTRAAEIHINPYDRGDAFYRDAKRQGIPSYRPAEDESRLILADMPKAIFSKREFELNRHLQLTTLRQWSLTLNPKYQRPGPSGLIKSLPLLRGTRFRLEIALADPSESNPDRAFIAGFENEVEVREDNLIREEVVFPVDFTDQPRLDSRTRLLVRLSPISNDPGILAPVTISSSFVPNPNGNDQSGGDIVVQKPEWIAQVLASRAANREIDLKESGTAWAARMPELPGSPIQALRTHYSASGHVDAYALDEAPPENWSGKNGLRGYELLSRFAESDGSRASEYAVRILQPFCTQDAIALADRAACHTDPRAFFDLTHFTIVDEVLNKNPTIADSKNYMESLSVTYFKESQKADRRVSADKVSTHAIAGVATKMGVGFLGNEATVNTALNIEGEWYDLKESSTGIRESSRKTAVDTVALSHEEIYLALDLKVRTCALVQPRKLARDLAQLKHKVVSGKLVCSGPVPRKHTETWYSVRDRWNAIHASASDPKHPLERGLYMVLRGEQPFNTFRNMLRSAVREERVFSAGKVDPFINGVDTLVAKELFTPAQHARLQRDGGIFPGVLHAQTENVVRWSAAQIEHYVDEYLETLRKAKASEQTLQWGVRYAWCFFEEAARRWEHSAYIEKKDSSTEFNAVLKKDGTSDRCKRAAGRLGVKP